MATLTEDDAAPPPAERSTEPSSSRPTNIFDAKNLARIAGVAIIYFATGKLGLHFASLTASSSPVWPATGIAFAALLILGFQIWPGIFIGAFFVSKLLRQCT